TEAAAAAAAERMRQEIAGRRFPRVGRVTVSIGTCVLSRAGSARELIRCADGALYLAKRQGRNRVCAYHPQRVALLNEAEMAAEHRRARVLDAAATLVRHAEERSGRSSGEGYGPRVAALSMRIAERLGWTE